MREGGQQVEFAASVGCGHFVAELTTEGGPGAVVRCFLRFLHEFGAGREVWEPDVVVIEAGEVGFGNAARRAPNGSQARTFPWLARCAELDDED